MSDKKSKTQGIWEIERPKSIKDQAMDSILDRIAEGHVSAGEPLPSESTLCREMGISRVALREAIKQLEVLGFLKIQRGSGTMATEPSFMSVEKVVEFLNKTSQISLKDLHELRSLIEVEAAKQVATIGDRELAEKLDKLLDEALQNVESERSYVDLDFAFHNEILNACPNKLMSMMLAPFESYLRKSRKLSFKSSAAARSTIDTHRKIVDAIRKRFPQGAKRIMEEHLEQTAKDLGLI